MTISGSPARPSADRRPGVLLRMAAPDLNILLEAATSPDRKVAEWGCLARFGWREMPDRLLLTLASLDPPQHWEMTATYKSVSLHAPYMRRCALAAETHGLAVGVIHIHPPGVAPAPSADDDELARYLAEYFKDFTLGRPFASLILSAMEGEIAVSGQVLHADRWLDIDRVAAERRPDVVAWMQGRKPPPSPIPPARVARLTSAFGREAFQRLQRSTVALIGAGGTGSAAIPILARAGVGRLIIVDGDHVSESNLERLHGSRPSDAANWAAKVAVAKRSVAEYAPDVSVEAIIGRLPQKEVLDAVLSADVIMGCTDQHSSRLTVADVAARYLIPAIDCGGLIEGNDGVVTGQLVQIVRFLADDPCPRCRGMISETRLQQEMLPTSERAQPAEQAAMAVAQGERADPILTAVPQIDTVGYITTTSGTIAAGFVIGWLTGRFFPRFERLQLDLVMDSLGAVDRPQLRRAGCSCGMVRGHADQAKEYAPIAPPPHWPPVKTQVQAAP
jgi:molybdopterin/thiamine biosynthesis adenylyltransferase